MNPKTLFLIPARGGSKGIPGKNIRPFNGKPLICHAIDCARGFAEDADICVSTDSEDIRKVAEDYGLEVPFIRPAELASDTAGSHEVMLHALDFYRQRGKDYERLVLLQPTSPLRIREDVEKVIAAWNPGIDMAVAVKKAATNPYTNAYEADGEGFLHISKGDGSSTVRRQCAPDVWEYTGAVYAITVASLRNSRMTDFRKTVGVEIPAVRSLDLDTPLDWKIAEVVASSPELWKE